MRKLAYVFVICIWCVPLLLAAPGSAVEEPPAVTAHREIMKITETGFTPPLLKLQRLDSTVFFLNSTPNQAIHLSIDFGRHRMHCANPNLKLDANGILNTVNPLRPRDFAISCFPEKGAYKVSARRSDKPGRSAEATVVVE